MWAPSGSAKSGVPWATNTVQEDGGPGDSAVVAGERLAGNAEGRSICPIMVTGNPLFNTTSAKIW